MLLKKINNAIEEKAMRQGIYFPCEEVVTVQLTLTDSEREEFYNLDLSDNYNYEINDNELCITYSRTK